MKKEVLRKCLLPAGIVIFFLLLSYAFVPQVLSGKIVNQSDISGYQGMAKETNDWNAAHPDDPTYWTGSMFSGMPNTSFSPSTKGDLIQPIYDLLLSGKRPASYLFISLLGAFLLMLSLGLDSLLAAAGAIAITFCSYNFQIIQVGHNTKMLALAFLPWVLAAVIYTYKSSLKEKFLPRTLLGASLFALALSFQIKANHQQISYYLAIMIAIYVIALFIYLIISPERRKQIGRFFIASALLLVIGIIGIGTNANKLVPLYEYTPYTMRGGSELAAEGNGDVNANGLSLDYATDWSYGWEELPNLMIPNFNGGSSSGAVGKNSQTYDVLKSAGQKNAAQIIKHLPMYWGPQPFTAGPMYMGAITVFLFLLGLMLCDPKDKWWMAVATLIAVLLALGSHFMGFTKFWYDYVPLYNKFRTVSMALTVLQFTLPMLGFLALQKYLDGTRELRKPLLIALGISGGFCLLMCLIPSLAGSFDSAADAGQPDILVDAFKADRRHLLTADAFRSLCFILLSAALLVWGNAVPKDAKKTFATHPEMGFNRRRTAAVCIGLLILIDLFTVDKRYLNSSDFVFPKDFTAQFDLRPVDKMIKSDTDPSFRVLDLSGNVFSDSHPSYHHHSIGGYSPAKLQRYQDLADRYLNSEFSGIYRAAQGAATIGELESKLPELPVLSMLNCRYIIFDGEIAPARNANAFGNAWFVDNAIKVNSPSEEIAALSGAELRNTAVIGPDSALKVPAADSIEGDFIEMTHYAPNELRYHYNISSERAVVFSEVYYPEGWHAWLADSPQSCPEIDASAVQKADAAAAGEKVELYRADWILRAAVLPAGEHTLIMRFDPQSYSTGIAMSRASSIALIILILLSIVGVIKWK